MVVQIPWNKGTGNITLTFTGEGNSSIIVSSDDNTLKESRSKNITVKTVDGTRSVTCTITQAAQTGDFSLDFSTDFFNNL